MKPLFLLLLLCLNSSLFAQWELRKDEDQIKVWTQKTEGSKFDSYKTSAILSASLENAVALLFDVKKSHEQYDVIRRTFEIKQLGPLKAEYYIDFDFPWPVTDRICKAHSEVKMLKDGVVELRTTSAPFDGDSDGKVIATSMYSIWTLEYIEELKTKVTLVGHMDPSGSIPGWLANRSVVDSPLSAIQKMRERLPLYKEVDIPFIE